MKDTGARPGLPDQFPDHLRSAEPRIRAALGWLDLTESQFAIKKDLLIGSRRWPDVAIDTVAVIQPGYVIGHRVFVVDGAEPGETWEGLGTVDEIVTLVRSWENETGARARR